MALSFEQQRLIDRASRIGAALGAVGGAGIGFAAGGWVGLITAALGLAALGYGLGLGGGHYLVWRAEQNRLAALRRLPFKQGLTISQGAEKLSMFVHGDKTLVYIRMSEDAWLEIAVANARRDGKAFQMTTVMSTEPALARNINSHFVGWEVLECRIQGVKTERREGSKSPFVAPLLEGVVPSAGPGDEPDIQFKRPQTA